jgi:hypothetical protein
MISTDGDYPRNENENLDPKNEGAPTQNADQEQQQNGKGNGASDYPEWALPEPLLKLLQRNDPALPVATRAERFVRLGVKYKIAQDNIINAALDPRPPYGQSIHQYIIANGGAQWIKAKIAEANDPNLISRPEPTETEPIRIYYAPYEANVTKAVDDTQKALVKLGMPIYQRNRQLVQPIFDDQIDEDGRLIRHVAFEILTKDSLRYFLNKQNLTMNLQYFTQRKVRDGHVSHDCGPPKVMLETLLSPKHWSFHKVRGLVTAPTLRADGSLLSERGYDEQTQLHACWEDSFVLPAIPERPTENDARAALQTLREDLLSEVAFVDKAKGLDEAVALAGLMTPVLHGAYRLCPLFMIIAPAPGTGKSYIADLASIIVNGLDAPVVPVTKDEAELEKRMVSILLEGAPLISIDNLTFDLKSILINQMCTQSIIKPRILGKSKTPSCIWHGTIFANGNNIRLVDDLKRRGLIINLDRKVERPQQWDYKKNPKERIYADRGKYVAAILTIARYYVSGPKVECTKFGGFERWSRSVREPLIALGLPDVIALSA